VNIDLALSEYNYVMTIMMMMMMIITAKITMCHMCPHVSLKQEL